MSLSSDSPSISLSNSKSSGEAQPEPPLVRASATRSTSSRTTIDGWSARAIAHVLPISPRLRPVMSRTVRSRIAEARYMTIIVLPVPGDPCSNSPRLRCRPASSSLRALPGELDGLPLHPREQAFGQDDRLAVDPGQPMELDLQLAIALLPQGDDVPPIDVPRPHRPPEFEQAPLGGGTIGGHHLDDEILAGTDLVLLADEDGDPLLAFPDEE